MAVRCLAPSANFFDLQKDKDNTRYEDLDYGEQIIVRKFVTVKEEEDKFHLKMIHLESSVQLVLYLTLLLFSLENLPLLELNYNEPEKYVASVKWILGLVLFFLKTLLSGYSTFSPIFRQIKKDTYKITGSAPDLMIFLVVALNILLEFIFAACTTFLERSFY